MLENISPSIAMMYTNTTLYAYFLSCFRFKDKTLLENQIKQSKTMIFAVYLLIG